ncbi:hypothetical protein HA466_0012180 [Hirschfeldia incana]|nr:hypothetical protein HA466_0012180 [Hirschfeldia incana]
MIVGSSNKGCCTGKKNGDTFSETMKVMNKGKGGIGEVFVGWPISGGNEPTAGASILETDASALTLEIQITSSVLGETRHHEREDTN